MGYIDVSDVSFTLPDGRPLLDAVSFRVGEGVTGALIGANGAGKSTLLRIIRRELTPDAGVVSLAGGLGVMDQFVGHAASGTVHDLLVSVAPARVRGAALELDASENALIEHDDTATQMRYATALADYADAGGYDQETVWDTCTMAALGVPWERARYRDVTSLSGGEQKRLVLEALFRGPEEVLLLDEPDNYLDVPGKRWLEEALRATRKTVLLVSHDRELLARAADRILTVELGAAGNTVWVHGGGFGDYHAGARRPHGPARRAPPALGRGAREAPHARADAEDQGDVQRRHGLALPGRADPARAGSRRPVRPRSARRRRTSRCASAARARASAPSSASGSSSPGSCEPFDLEVWYGERVAVLGSNGSGKSHFLRPLARGGTEPDRMLGHVTSIGQALAPVPHTGRAVLGARVVPGWFAQTHHHPELAGRTLLDILHRGDDGPRRPAARGRELRARPLRTRALGAAELRVALAAASRRACRSCCSSSPARPCCCSTSRPTTSTWSRPRRSRRGWPPSTAPCSPSPTTAGSPAASTATSSSAATATSTSPTEPVWDEARVARAR